MSACSLLLARLVRLWLCQVLPVMMIGGVLGGAMVLYFAVAPCFFGVCISGFCGSLRVCLGSECVLLWCTAGP